MRSIKARRTDGKGLLLIYNIIVLTLILIVNIFGENIGQLLSVYFAAFVINIILIVDWIIKRRAAERKLTEADKKRLMKIKNLIDAKRYLNAKLFEYLIIVEGKFEFVKASADHIGNGPIAETLTVVERINEILKKADAEELKNAEQAFAHDNFYRLKSGIEQMNEAIDFFINEHSDSGMFGDDEIKLLRNAAGCWSASDGESAQDTCEMLAKYLKLINSAVDGIVELREY